MPETSYWRVCSSCKKPIGFDRGHWICNVSTCNKGNTALAFCSVPCWEAHVPSMRHREAWAEERRSPTRVAWEARAAAEGESRPVSSRTTSAPKRTAGSSLSPAGSREVPTGSDAASHGRRRIVVGSEDVSDGHSGSRRGAPREILIVASKLKAYVKASSDMNTSDRVLEALSDKVRDLCDNAADRARAEGRKTVLDRDF